MFVVLQNTTPDDNIMLFTDPRMKGTGNVFKNVFRSKPLVLSLLFILFFSVPRKTLYFNTEKKNTFSRETRIVEYSIYQLFRIYKLFFDFR